MGTQLLGLGVLGVRLFECALVVPARQPDELSEHLLRVIRDYLPEAEARERPLLLHLARELPDCLGLHFERVGDFQSRRHVIYLLGTLVDKYRMLIRSGV